MVGGLLPCVLSRLASCSVGQYLDQPPVAVSPEAVQFLDKLIRWCFAVARDMVNGGAGRDEHAAAAVFRPGSQSPPLASVERLILRIALPALVNAAGDYVAA
jgi:hypothetical protein